MIKTIQLVICCALVTFAFSADDEIIIVGGTGENCTEDPGCINRLHPDIPMTHRASPGQTILFRTRDANDVLGTIAVQDAEPKTLERNFGAVHPMAGPVYIEGASPGDVLKVTIQNIDPGKYGFTRGGGGGFVPDLVGGELLAIWRLNRDFAETDDIPGIKIPNASFPGVVSVLPGPVQLANMLEREEDLASAGGRVFLPFPEGASPESVCGPSGSAFNECLRTIPPREHGGNMDIRYLQAGVSIYLPCYIDGCGLTIGDLHYAQGDGEVSGTAIEMSANVWVNTEIIKNGPDLFRGPHYEGASNLLDIPSRRFYAVTGIPVKGSGSVPPDMKYLNSDVVPGLSNLSNDINLAARNALAGIIDYIVSEYGYSRNQAYIIASVAVDLRISQLVDAPNVGVTALLPLDIFND
ncbi:MAG: acetamidase/formamidase family protein [Gammaproteobacteria bacterium]|nr:acetamidase/formamidase family protein [Gammaproteobacteria bacterium]